MALNSFRVEAQVRRQALEVRRSASRLMTVDEAERQALADRLRLGPIARLERVGVICAAAIPMSSPVITELDRVITELNRLAHGLNPVTVSTRSLPAAP